MHKTTAAAEHMWSSARRMQTEFMPITAQQGKRDTPQDARATGNRAKRTPGEAETYRDGARRSQGDAHKERYL